MKKKILLKLAIMKIIGGLLLIGNFALVCDYYFKLILFPNSPKIAQIVFFILLCSLIFLVFYSVSLFKEIKKLFDIDIFKIFRDEERSYSTLMDNPIIDFFSFYIMVLFRLHKIIEEIQE
ncbi:hypothetical protein [Fusibacter sp. 3D3]|uniref:hypothetical protein n=1 Tax=Fusibacter sp. 3D3 TaxID=1048380 RepID=UPI0008533293|nr:hypothetical protein [Fusibacter sp. 3D3]